MRRAGLGHDGPRKTVRPPPYGPAPTPTQLRPRTVPGASAARDAGASKADWAAVLAAGLVVEFTGIDRGVLDID
ncbi:hypothetical protein ACFU7Y_42520 [Kitasatospora sp. NPDC057542]|uniref:hypothetical protein n=1 Tax=Kitasatospora sp. NPDC057542 TaxID=3346162 RepID=UPI00367FB4F3